MKKFIKSVFKLKTLGVGSLLGFVLLNAACNKDFDNVLPQKFKNDTAGIGNNAKKVLYIIMDGVRGSVVRNIAPSNLTQITNKAIYSYDGLADYQLNSLTNAAAWTTMTTGVDYTKHNVTSESFAGLNLQATPTVFTRLKQSLGNIRMVSFAATAAFNDNLAADATLKQNFADDAAVKTAVVNELNTNDPALLVAQFHSAETAGAANGYTESATAYTSAIANIDGYIGEIMAALRARKGYAGENWLVIVASNKGGGPSGGLPGSNIFNDASRNTYLAFCNPKFSPSQVNQPNVNSLPYVGFAPNFSGNNSAYTAAVASNNTLGDFGTSGDYTVMVKVRMDHASTAYPPFIGKTPDFKSGSGTTGWVFFSAGDTWTMKISGTGTQLAGDKVRDGVWHTLAMRLYTNNGRKAKIYTDNKVSAELSIPATANMSAPTVPFTLGHINSTESNGTINVLIKDVAIYNIAIPETELLAYMKKTVKLPTDPYYNNLIGYWPCDDNQGNTIREASGKGVNLTYVGAPNWKSFSDTSPYISPEISQAAYQAVPNGVDIPVLIYNWMNIAVPSQWNLMGKLYTPTINFSTN